MYAVNMFRIVFIVIIFGLTVNNKIASAKDEDCTDLARDDETLLVFSTLGGGLTAVDPLTSQVRWSIEDEPAVQVPSNNDVENPQYLPDPRDGTLYQLGERGGLKKLPYTIPQLVASAPCRSSDGILYSGKKSDTWFLIDPKTGRREEVLGFGSPPQYKDSIGWATSRSMYLGRTQYTVLMYDSRSEKKDSKPWNVTFFDYSSHTMAPEVSKDYEWLHLTATASGMTVTLDRTKGTFMWQLDLSSPVVATFILASEGLLSVPFTTVSDDTLRSIVEFARDGQKNDIKLFQTLYVGEHSNGLYALPSLVDKNVATISSDPPVKLLDGPHNNAEPNQNLVYLNTLLQRNNEDVHDNNVIVLGHYQMPKTNENLKLTIMPSISKKSSNNKELATQQQREFEILNINRNGATDFVILPHKGNTIDVTLQKDKEDFNKTHRNPKEMLAHFYQKSKSWLNDQESQILKMLLIILIGLIIAMFWYMRCTVRELRLSQSGSNTSNISKSSGSYQELIDLGQGEVKIGKIGFNSHDVLGKGCEGTFVFKGSFEKRNVAVKRLLPECFTLADREVSLLRESDAHENVVRYFCTEQDRQFKYIAVELCAATLQDYVEGKQSGKLQSQITVLEVLRQATNGLAHLHSLNIVHRDIKPQNVLLSLPDAYNSVRAMISDFGLCKKLNYGKTSFSRRSGITGTEGWIAPEMLKGQRTTTSVDLFSMGCVFYYVISNGGHPFGDTVKRQANILSYEYDLKYFKREEVNNFMILAQELIVAMISKDPINRPPAKVILNHPFFWNEDKILNFLQDVSDRVEKADYQSVPLLTLEKNSKFICRGDWILHLDECITADLKKYRGYHGHSIRDLLRAVRNKKHHYHELTTEMQTVLGSLPTEFTKYWIRKFPHFVSHSFHALQQCSTETIFRSYYSQRFTFAKPDYFYQITDDFVPQEREQRPGKDNNRTKMNNDKRYDDGGGGGGGGKYSPNRQSDNRPNRKGLYNFHRFNNNNNNNHNDGNGTGTGTNAGTSGDGNTETGLTYRNLNYKKRKENASNNVRWTLPTDN